MKSNKTHRIQFLFANSLLSTIKKVSEVLTKWRQIQMKRNIEENWAWRAKDQATVYHNVTNTSNFLNRIKSRRISVEETTRKEHLEDPWNFLFRFGLYSHLTQKRPKNVLKYSAKYGKQRFLEKIQTPVEKIDLISTNFQLISVNLVAELLVAAGPLIYLFFVV